MNKIIYLILSGVGLGLNNYLVIYINSCHLFISTVIIGVLLICAGIGTLVSFGIFAIKLTVPNGGLIISPQTASIINGAKAQADAQMQWMRDHGHIPKEIIINPDDGGN